MRSWIIIAIQFAIQVAIVSAFIRYGRTADDGYGLTFWFIATLLGIFGVGALSLWMQDVL